MVRRAVPPVVCLTLLLVLALAGCGFFTASLFPGYLAQVEKSYDLGSRIDSFLASVGSAEYRWYPQVFVLTSDAGVDYGGVLIEIDSRPEKMLLLADPDGNVQQLAEKELITYYLGQLHLKAADAVNQFVVGQYQFAPDDLATTASPISGINGYYRGFSDATSTYNYLVWSNDPLTLAYQRYGPSWSAGGTTNYATIDTYGGFEMRGVFYDAGATTGREVVLVLFDYSSNRVLTVFTPLADYSGGSLPTSPETILSTYPYLSFDDVDAGNVIYTRKGIVLADYDGKAALMDFSGTETGKKLDLGQHGEVRLALDIAGEHFYVFNPEDQMLYMGKTGW
jgi:hypothetical protein